MTVFITTRAADAGGDYGSSLYCIIQANGSTWVLRCSGNSRGGRTPTTFIRYRAITYQNAAGAVAAAPAVGLSPVEGGHHGNNITAIVDNGNDIPLGQPGAWVAHNGVTWAEARAEVLAAIAFVQNYDLEEGEIVRRNREVGQQDWVED